MGSKLPPAWWTGRSRTWGWRKLAQRFGPVLGREHPSGVLGHMSEEFFRLGLIAHLSRSKPLRAAARFRPEQLQETRATDATERLLSRYPVTMLRGLDCESLMAVHPASAGATRCGPVDRPGPMLDVFRTVLAGRSGPPRTCRDNPSNLAPSNALDSRRPNSGIHFSVGRQGASHRKCGEERPRPVPARDNLPNAKSAPAAFVRQSR
jgi:hypothetical protein